MEIKVELIKETKEETLSKMYIDGIYYCYILEDEEHKVKINGDTRIPAGRYKITYRTVGTWYKRVLSKITGAKGSNVNHSQVGVMLGQQ